MSIQKLKSISLCLFLCVTLVVCFSTQVNATPNGNGKYAKRVYKDVSGQNYSDEMVVYQLALEPGAKVESPLSLMLKGRVEDEFPFPINSTGPFVPELIWGDDSETLQLYGVRESGFYLTFQSEKGMRTVTGLLSEDLSTGFLVIKVWDGGLPGLSFDVGVAHNQVLDYLTPDKIVRKRPGRRSYGDITLKNGVINVHKDTAFSYGVTQSFLSTVYSEQKFSFPEELGRPVAETSAADGYNDYRFWKSRTGMGSAVEDYLSELEGILLTSKNYPELMIVVALLDREIASDPFLKNEQVDFLLATTNLARSSVTYWNGGAEQDIFDGDIIERKGGPFWADVAGFIGGFTGQLVYNNNGGSGNPFTTGATTGGFASALAKLREEEQEP